MFDSWSVYNKVESIFGFLAQQVLLWAFLKVGVAFFSVYQEDTRYQSSLLENLLCLGLLQT